MNKIVKISIFLIPIFLISLIILILIFNNHQKKIGGDAISGYYENNKYYIGIDEFNNYKEGSKSDWLFSKYIFITLMICSIFFIILFGIIVSYFIFPLIFKKLFELKELFKI